MFSRGVSGVVAVLIAVILGWGALPANAQGPINFHWSRAGVPTDSDQPSSYPVFTFEGQSVVITTGDARYTDPFGLSFDFPGKGGGEDRASVVIVIGPVGTAYGGRDVALTLRPRYEWTGVTINPNGPALTSLGLARLVNSQINSLRNPANKNGRDGGALTGKIDVAVIDGKTGAVRYVFQIYPSQGVVE